MNYQTMQHLTRDKHQQMRQQAQNHRLARQVKSNQVDPGRSDYRLKLAGVLVSLAAIAAVNIIIFFQ